MNEGAMTLAERARALDDSNLLAHAHLAREYLVRGIEASQAEEAIKFVDPQRRIGLPKMDRSWSD